MTDQQRLDWRKEWDEAEKRVRAKPKQQRIVPTGKQVAVKPLLNVEHCESCNAILPRGHVRITLTGDNPRLPSAFQFLCSTCQREATA